MAKRDYYEILGLDISCNPQDIRKSYRNLALKWHPDKHIHKKEAESKFSEIHEAYSVLTNSEHKSVYDRHGHAGLERFLENQDAPNQPNIYFTKGFQGTDKSAFEVLCDIIFDRDGESTPQEKQESNSPKDFHSNFESFMSENFFDNNDEFEFLTNYTPTFHDPNFMFSLPFFNQERAPSTSTKTQPAQKTQNTYPTQKVQPSTSGIKANMPTKQNTPRSQEQQFYEFGNFQPNFEAFNPFNAASPFFVIDDEASDASSEYEAFSAQQSQAHNSFMSEINQFQSFLDQFHRTIEGGLDQFGTINTASKKISKKEKIERPMTSKKEHTKGYGIPSVPIYS